MADARWITRAFWFVRLFAKRLVLWLHLGPLMEYCKTCGARVDEIWTAPTPLWLRVVGEPESVRCIGCFDRQSTDRGFMVRWVPHIEAINNGRGRLGWSFVPFPVLDHSFSPQTVQDLSDLTGERDACAYVTDVCINSTTSDPQRCGRPRAEHA